MPRVTLTQAEIALYTYGRKVKTGRVVPSSDYVIDVDGLRDPLSNRGFKNEFRDGRPVKVREFIKEDPRVPAIIDTVKLLVEAHVRSVGHDRTWVAISLRDHHGKWIAPAIGEVLADTLAADGYKVSLMHIDLEGQS